MDGKNLLRLVEWAFTGTDPELTKKVNDQWAELKQYDDSTLVRIMDSDPDHSRRMSAQIILESRMKRRRNL